MPAAHQADAIKHAADAAGPSAQEVLLSASIDKCLGITTAGQKENADAGSAYRMSTGARS